uniref:Uncharacterized protein n=1 Tax=Schistocephalus solidus TaxID=70667 RepID=A0A0X3PZY3_SCHSO
MCFPFPSTQMSASQSQSVPPGSQHSPTVFIGTWFLSFDIGPRTYFPCIFEDAECRCPSFAEKYLWSCLKEMPTNFAALCTLSSRISGSLSCFRGQIKQTHPFVVKFRNPKSFFCLINCINHFIRWPKAIPAPSVEASTVNEAFISHCVTNFDIFPKRLLLVGPYSHIVPSILPSMFRQYTCLFRRLAHIY